LGLYRSAVIYSLSFHLKNLHQKAGHQTEQFGLRRCVEGHGNFVSDP